MERPTMPSSRGELEPSWPPPAVIRVGRAPPPMPVSIKPSMAPPGIKRLGWVQAFVGAGIALVFFGWKAHDVAVDYPTKVETAAACASAVAVEAQTRGPLVDQLRARIEALEKLEGKAEERLRELERRTEPKRKLPLAVYSAP